MVTVYCVNPIDGNVFIPIASLELMDGSPNMHQLMHQVFLPLEIGRHLMNFQCHTIKLKNAYKASLVTD